MLNKIKMILCYASGLGIIIYLNIRALDMTYYKLIFDPVNWLFGFLSCGLLLLGACFDNKT